VCYDDGAVVYLNGQKIQTINVAGDITYTTPAGPNTIGGTDETTFFEFAIDPSHLKEGQNVLAVEVHQVSSTSTDTSFDLELEGTWPDDEQPTGKPVYYTINNTDPRLPGGAVNTANVQLYTTRFPSITPPSSRLAPMTTASGPLSTRRFSWSTILRLLLH
jgi:hypothetical protein